MTSYSLHPKIRKKRMSYCWLMMMFGGDGLAPGPPWSLDAAPSESDLTSIARSVSVTMSWLSELEREPRDTVSGCKQRS